ncbi:hypothetical protein [Bradyrhizobium sp. HKCCYLR20261]|uniref:hypothetical protein n=1 Tax=Bradyrhizobium sp. HKCCYLR20261 TaxID=3420760 RepID=UPI003EC0EBDB
MIVAPIFDKQAVVVMDSGLIRAASKWLRHFARECPGMTSRERATLAQSDMREETRAIAAVIASAAKQSRVVGGTLDCFAALAMTR